MWPLIIAAGIGAAAGLAGRNKNKNLTTYDSKEYSGTQYASPYLPAMGIYDNYNQLLWHASQAPLQYYTGQGYVGPSDATQRAWGLQQGAIPYYTGGARMASRGVPLYGQGAGMMMQGTRPMMQGAGMMGGAARSQAGILGTSGQNFGQLSTAADVANNPWVQGQLGANAQQVGQQLRESWLPAIQQGAAGGRAMGSSRQGIAQGQGIERTAQQLANTNAATMLNAYGQGLGAQQYALGQTGAMMEAQKAPAQTLFQGGQMMGAAGQQAAAAGGLYGQGAAQLGQAGNLQQQASGAAYGTGASQEMYEQRKLQDAMSRWNFQQMEPWQRLNMTQQGLNTFLPFATQHSSGSSSGTTTGPNPYYQSPFQAALGGAAMGMGMYNAFGGGGGGGGPGGNYPAFNMGYSNPYNYGNPMYGYMR